MSLFLRNAFVLRFERPFFEAAPRVLFVCAFMSVRNGESGFDGVASVFLFPGEPVCEDHVPTAIAVSLVRVWWGCISVICVASSYVVPSQGVRTSPCPYWI